MTVTFKELFALYYTRHALIRTRCPANAKYFISKHGATWGDRRVASVTRKDVQDWVDALGVDSVSAATRAVNMLSAIINWGARRQIIPDFNPCRGVERFRVKSRERFLMPAEMERFKDALAKQPETLRDFFTVCLLTGARKGNVLRMRWDEVDLTLAIWQFDSKNGDTQCLPLSRHALTILKRRQTVYGDEQWVFPGKKPGSHLIDPKRAWKRLLKAAGIADLRIHDLRRTLGSYLAMAGESQYIVGKALGHRDPRSTAVYARLNLAPVREAIERAQTSTLGDVVS